MPQPTSSPTTPPTLPSQTYHDHPQISSSSLPSFYSPRPTAPTPRTIPDFDLNQHNHTSSQQLPYLPPSDSKQDGEDGGETTQYNHIPPSLLSPAFTPPATPGTSTPALQRQAHSVPVDSTDLVNGGVPVGKPRLLEKLPEVVCAVRARIPTTTGTEMFLHLYQNNIDNKEHLAIVFGGNIRSRSLDAARPGETEMDRMIRGAYTGRLYPGRTSSRLPSPLSSSSTSATATSDPQRQDRTPAQQSQIPLVRIHSECYTGETAWSARCDCGEQLDEAARLMSLPSPSGSPVGGVIIYLRQEGRGIGLSEKLKAYNLQDLGSDTVEANLLLRHPADARSYGLATAMLMDLGLREVRLLTNNPEKVRAVEGPGREVVVRERVAMVPIAWRTGGREGVRGVEVGGYLKAKIEKMGHLLQMNEGAV